MVQRMGEIHALTENLGAIAFLMTCGGNLYLQMIKRKFKSYSAFTMNLKIQNILSNMGYIIYFVFSISIRIRISI